MDTDLRKLPFGARQQMAPFNLTLVYSFLLQSLHLALHFNFIAIAFLKMHIRTHWTHLSLGN